jgi:hypothetical protein
VRIFRPQITADAINTPPLCRSLDLLINFADKGKNPSLGVAMKVCAIAGLDAIGL